MMKVTKKSLKELVASGKAVDLTYEGDSKRAELCELEGYLTQIAYSCGIYGCTGKLLQGNRTGQLYAICDRTNAIYIF